MHGVATARAPRHFGYASRRISYRPTYLPSGPGTEGLRCVRWGPFECADSLERLSGLAPMSELMYLEDVPGDSSGSLTETSTGQPSRNCAGTARTAPSRVRCLWQSAYGQPWRVTVTNIDRARFGFSSEDSPNRLPVSGEIGGTLTYSYRSSVTLYLAYPVRRSP